MRNRIYTLILCGLLVMGNGCADLDVPNPNNPDTERVLAKPDDLKGVVSGAFVSMYSIFGDATNAYYANTNLEWTADYITMTNNVRAWWSQFKIEPRVQFNNTLAFTDLDVVGRPFKQLHAAISSANDVIRAIETRGIQIGANGAETPMVLASAYFCKAMAQGYLANTFDRAYIVNPDDDPLTVPLSSYQDVMTASLANFDKVIELSTASTFTLPGNFINTAGGGYTNVKLARLARTYAANFMVQNARNRAENALTNWDKVLEYTSNGLIEDYVINLDGANWQNGLQSIAGLNWYWRVDHRVIRLMDPTYPKRFPLTANTYPKATSADKRLDLYFFYEPGLGFFRTDRGPQLRSHYRFKRFDQLYTDAGVGPSPFLYAYTNDLLRAEALAMKGDLAGATAILNAGKRVTVGELPPIAGASQAEVLATVFAERDIELQLTDFAIHFKDMRRRMSLKRGTILHFPVPANELAVVREQFYSYGGQGNADGKNTADGSNSWLND